ncbi:MAG TPA: AAA family ATPase, partial [Desulfuromonadales bacterium]|nr:AAA family ATPase [Desulfuromonadales bacterium]
MLINLTIANFAIIDRLEVQFDEGFNVLTGETGAGKSIILDAFGLLLGDRARPDLVRAGASEATVEALFDLTGRDDILHAFTAAGFSVDDELVLRRIVQSGGRSRAYVNGNLVTLAQLQPLSELLVTVCGQHEHQSLLQRNVHLTVLD